MRTEDVTLARDVEDELRSEPALGAGHISASVSGGAVTLAGAVESYFERALAEAVVMRVKGVRVVANDTTVEPPLVDRLSDSDIASAAAHALNWNVAVPKSVQAVVKEGWLTLHGAVTWPYERLAAERAVRDLRAIRGITNLITVESRPVSADIKSSLERRVARSALVDSSGVVVQVDESRVILLGVLPSAVQRDEAERLAWSTAGVTEVDNRIALSHSEAERDRD